MFTESQIKTFVSTCKEKIAAYKLQNKDIYFSAKFYRKNKVSEEIKMGAIDTFSKLLRSHVLTEAPDRITVCFLEKETHSLLYEKSVKSENEPESEPIVVQGLLGLGEVKELVDKGIAKYKEETQQEILRKRYKRSLLTIGEKDTLIAELSKQIETLEGTIEDFEDTIATDKRLQGYVAIAAEAFPSLNSIIQKSTLRGLLGVPKEEIEMPQVVNEKADIAPERLAMIEGLSNYFQSPEYELLYLHQMYELFRQITLKPELLETLLNLVQQ